MSEASYNKPPENALVKLPQEVLERETALPEKLSLDSLADTFVAVCDPTLTAVQIRDGMITRGFPAALVAEFGESFLILIEGVKKKLDAIDPEDIELAVVLRDQARINVIEYFGSQQATIERFSLVSQNPAGYLKTVDAVLSHFTEGQIFQLPDAELEDMLSRVRSLSGEVSAKILKAAASRIAEAGIAGLGHILVGVEEIPNGSVMVAIKKHETNDRSLSAFLEHVVAFMKKVYPHVAIEDRSYAEERKDVTKYKFSLLK